jgi:hypothetical protein
VTIVFHTAVKLNLKILTYCFQSLPLLFLLPIMCPLCSLFTRLSPVILDMKEIVGHLFSKTFLTSAEQVASAAMFLQPPVLIFLSALNHWHIADFPSDCELHEGKVTSASMTAAGPAAGMVPRSTSIS